MSIRDVENQVAQVSDKDTVRFRRPIQVPIIVSLYACCLLVAWSIICTFSRHLLVPLPKDFYNNTMLGTAKQEADAHAHINVNLRWYRTARVLWGVASVLTLPLASSVCSFFAVGYVQAQKYPKRGPTLRQTLTLTDRGWTNPRVIFSFFRHSRKECTSFLWVALALHLVGGIINPLQQLFVGQGIGTIIFPPTELHTFYDITSLTDTHSLAYRDSGATVARLRPTLVTAHASGTSNYIWQGNSSCRLNTANSESPSLFKCQRATVNSAPYTPSNSTLDLFTSPMVPRTNTGMLRQFAPRMNSSLSWTDIQIEDFPRNCSVGNGFFRNYTSPIDENSGRYYSLSVCMQGNLSHTPFKRTRDRQDFNETIFISTNYFADEASPGNATWRLTLSSTLGYFELPNKRRGGSYGPLLDKDPLLNCTPPRCGGRQPPTSRPPNYGYDQNGNWYLDLVPSKGPLTVLTLALFGNDSFIDTHNDDISGSFHRVNAQDDVCYGYNPLSLVMGEDEECSSGSSFGDRVATWVSYFSMAEYAVSALSQASLLANHAILASARGGETLTIYERESVDYSRPEISATSMTVLWLLIATYLPALILLCFLATMSVAWDDSLDSHAMVAMTASLCSRTSLLGDHEPDEEKDLLDALPGYVGDATPDSPVGTLGIGANSPLQWNRRYWKNKDLAL
ncbi:unnamed protein product [Penicillium salamii]|nr:unnamed protein product [Penicillium salamii]CAG8332662.1 unnamed protein product [Penicillium salamii]